MGCQISKRNISFHKLKAISYVCLICQRVVGFAKSIMLHVIGTIPLGMCHIYNKIWK